MTRTNAHVSLFILLQGSRRERSAPATSRTPSPPANSGRRGTSSPPTLSSPEKSKKAKEKEKKRRESVAPEPVAEEPVAVESDAPKKGRRKSKQQDDELPPVAPSSPAKGSSASPVKKKKKRRGSKSGCESSGAEEVTSPPQGGAVEQLERLVPSKSPNEGTSGSRRKSQTPKQFVAADEEESSDVDTQDEDALYAHVERKLRKVS